MMVNGDLSNQQVGFDPHAAHIVRLSNGGLIMAGTSLYSELLVDTIINFYFLQKHLST